MSKSSVGRSHITNIYKFNSQKINDVLTVQGSIEYATCLQLEYAPTVEIFSVQPTKFYYDYEGKTLPYTPDFFVFNSQLGKFYIENKYTKKILNDDFKLRFKAKQMKVAELGIPLILVTEKQTEITPLYENLRLLNRYGKSNTLTPLCQQVLKIISDEAVIKLSKVMELSGANKPDIIVCALGLLAKGHIFTDLLNTDISLDSYVWVEGAVNTSDPVFELGCFEDEYDDLFEIGEKKKTLIKIKFDNDEPQTLERSFETYSTELQQEALRRFDILTWVSNRLEGGWTQKNLEPLLSEAAIELQMELPNWRTLARWNKEYHSAGESVLALLPKTERKGNRCEKLSDEENDIFNRAVLHYLDKKRDSIRSTFRYYEGLLWEHNNTQQNQKLKGLSYTGFYKRIKKLPLDKVDAARHGRLKAEREYKALGAFVPGTRIMEKVQIDHTPMDVILLDDELRIPIGRAYMTAIIDTYSRSVVGMYFGYKHPSYYSVMKALLNMLKPKSYIKTLFPNIENEWVCHGDIELLVVDNGREFWGNNIEEACKFAKFDMEFNKVKHPWCKPNIERFFETVNNKFYSPIPGKTFSTILAKEDYDPAKDAVMRFSVFNRLFHKWLVDDYHHDADDKLTRLPPFYLWQQSAAEFPIQPIDEVRIKEIEIGLGYTDYKMHRKGGIHIHNLRYDSDELAKYRPCHTKTVNGKKTSGKLLVKTNPDDISSIRVYIDKIKQFLVVPCVDHTGYTIGLSLHKHKILCDLHKEHVSSTIDTDKLAEIRIGLHHRIEQETDDLRQYFRQGKVKSMSRLASHQGVASDSIGTVVPEPLPQELIEHVESKESKATTKETNTDSLSDEEGWDDYLDSLEIDEND